MRAVVCRELGPLSNVIVEQRPDLEPGPGQVVVEVRAAGVNYVDGLMCQGRYQMKPPAPFVPGGEVAGVVRSVGDGVSRVQAGDRVMTMTGFGAFAEQVCVADGSLELVPPSMSYAQAAAFIQSYSTAWFSLARRAQLQEGEWVLVLGAGGGVGLAACDLALSLGARVIAAASTPDKLDAARAMGASHGIAYESEDLKERARHLAGGAVDVVVDPVGGRHSEPALRALGRFGRFCVIGFAAGAIASVPLNQVLLNNRTIIGVDWGAWAFSAGSGQAALLGELLAMVHEGRLHPTVPREEPLEQARSVMAGLIDRSLSGKFVLVP